MKKIFRFCGLGIVLAFVLIFNISKVEAQTPAPTLIVTGPTVISRVYKNSSNSQVNTISFDVNTNNQSVCMRSVTQHEVYYQNHYMDITVFPGCVYDMVTTNSYRGQTIAPTVRETVRVFASSTSLRFKTNDEIVSKNRLSLLTTYLYPDGPVASTTIVKGYVLSGIRLLSSGMVWLEVSTYQPYSNWNPSPVLKSVGWVRESDILLSSPTLIKWQSPIIKRAGDILSTNIEWDLTNSKAINDDMGIVIIVGESVQNGLFSVILNNFTPPTRQWSGRTSIPVVTNIPNDMGLHQRDYNVKVKLYNKSTENPNNIVANSSIFDGEIVGVLRVINSGNTNPGGLSSVCSVNGNIGVYSTNVSLNEEVRWSVRGYGGRAPYTYYFSDRLGQIENNSTGELVRKYTDAGIKIMSLAVIDADNNNTGWSLCPYSANVVPATTTTSALQLTSCTPSTTSATTGTTVTWNATATGGTAPYRYYFSDVSGVVIDNTTGNISRTYTTTGSKSMSIAVGDATNAKTAWAFCTGNVNVTSSTVTPVVTSPAITPWTGPSSVTSGTNLSYSINFNAVKTTVDQTIFVHFVDSTGTNRFVSSVSPSTRTTQWTGTVSTPVTVAVPAGIPAGTYKVMAGLYTGTSGRLPLTAGSGVTADNQTRYQVGTITVNAPSTPLTLSCTPSVTSATTGTTVTWNATARGGVTPYRYYFSDVANQISDTTTGSITRTYTTTGQKYMSIAVIDAANTKVDWAFCTGNVNVTAPTVVPPVVTPPTTPSTSNPTINTWSGPATVVAGNSFSYNLNWNGGPTAENETIFVHFIDSAGNMKFYNIVTPGTPTKQWSGTVSTPISVTVPAGTPAGTYRVMVGMYVPSTNGSSGPRLSLTTGSGVTADNQTRYQVGIITVTSTGGTGSVWNAIRSLLKI